MSQDDELRELFNDIAGQAHDPARLAPEIVARARVHRQRRGLLVAAGAVGTTAVLGGTGVAGWLWSGRNTPVAEGPGTRVPLRYGLSWVPDGFVESSRSATVPGTGPEEQGRAWRGAGELVLSLEPVNESLRPHLQTRTIGGRRAWLGLRSAAGYQVHVDVDDELWLTVCARGTENLAEIVHRAAASVIVEESAVCAVSLTFGWQPERFTGVQTVRVGGPAGTVFESLEVRSKDPGDQLIARLVPHREPLPRGTKATIRGRSGSVHEGGVETCATSEPECGSQTNPFADVDLGDGRQLQIVGLDPDTTSIEEMIRIANEVRIGRPPDTSWLQK